MQQKPRTTSAYGRKLPCPCYGEEREVLVLSSWHTIAPTAGKETALLTLYIPVKCIEFMYEKWHAVQPTPAGLLLLASHWVAALGQCYAHFCYSVLLAAAAAVPPALGQDCDDADQSQHLQFAVGIGMLAAEVADPPMRQHLMLLGRPQECQLTSISLGYIFCRAWMRSNDLHWQWA